VIGVSSNDIDIINPLPCGRGGWIPQSTFEGSFSTFGNMAVVIK
jgi:hypothetical protein